MELSRSLAELVQRLDALPTEASLPSLAGILEAVKLTPADLSAFVEETSRTYHRASVVRRDHYELLVLTWLPGQGSVPHDHAGAVSAMLVVQGTALEGSWRIAEDGYVDLEYETQVRSGRLTAWQDSGVHTVRNSSQTSVTLITVNIYAPPLKEFRRFAARPAGLPSALSLSPNGA